jgi:hypothetical protein
LCLPVEKYLLHAQTSNLKRKKIAAIGLVSLDSVSVVPNTVFVQGFDTSYYSVDAVSSLLTWKKPIGIDSVTIIYRVFPLQLGTIIRRVNYDSIKNKFVSQSSIFNRKTSLTNELFDFGTNININGSYGRSIGFGNKQDAVFNSQLNLQVSGIVGDSIRLDAVITDNNIPIQPDGTTRQINEFDKVLLQFRKKGWEINMGDIDLLQNQNYFLHFYKRLQGISYQRQTLSAKEGSDKLLVSAAIARGRFTRNIFQGQEGNQGPYRLQGANNEMYFIVLANTEKVFIDGELLQRGQDQDYTIDYNTASITFTPKRLITIDKRIQIEFEYSDRNFLNSLAYVSDERVFNNRFKLNVAAYNDGDAKNCPINQTLDNKQKKFLANLGDSVQNAFYPSAFRDTFSIKKILYARMKSPLCTDSIYRYSTNSDSAVYSLNFVEMGNNKGNYIPLFNGINGNVYQWVTPVNGVLQGNYEPALFLVTPRKQQLITISTEYKIDSSTVVNMAMAFSNYDANTYSSKNKNNDVGYAGKIDLIRNNKWYTHSKVLQVKTSMGYECVDSRFKPLEDLHGVEFARDWGLELTPAVATGHLPYASIEIRDDKNNFLLYNVSGYLRSDNYKGMKQSAQYNQKNKGWQYKANFNLTNNSTPCTKGFFLRPSVEISKLIPRLKNYTIGVSYVLEQNEQRNISTDSLTSLSFANKTFSVFLQSNQKQNNHWSFIYSNRSNELPDLATLITADNSHTFNFLAELLENKKHHMRVNVSYRQLSVQNNTLSSQKPDHTLLGRIEYMVNECKGLVTGRMLYETGAGQEQRKDFYYMEVPVGQGQYAWNDYNKDGITQLNEFEIASFSDQAKYVRVFIPMNEYIKANYTQFNYSLLFNPAATHNIPSTKLSSLIAKFSLQSSVQTDKKIVSGGNFEFNPFHGKISDTNLISLNTAVNNTLSFNRFSSSWGLDLSNSLHYNKSILTYGFESLQFNEWALRGRVNFHQQYTITVTQKISDNNLYTPSFTNRNYQLQTISCEPEFIYTYSNLFRLHASYQYDVKHNLTVYGGERSVNTSFNLGGKFNAVNNTSLSGAITYSNITFNGAANTSISYIMLNGLSPGKNYLWNIEFTKRLINNLEINLGYEGRKPGETKVIHTGRATVRALL